MNRFISTLAGAVFTLTLAASMGAATAQADTLDLDKFEQQVKGASVQLADPNHRPMCSGTVVASKRDEKTAEVKTLILTAQHCVKESPYRTYYIRVPEFQGNSTSSAVWANAKVVKQGSDSNDLAILQLDDKRTSYATVVAKVAKEKVELRWGEATFAVGYPLAAELTVSEGRLASSQEYNFPDADKDLTFLRTTNSLSPGNSGGGLFHATASGDFELIGVSDWVAGTPTSTFAAFNPPDRIAPFLVSYDKDLFPGLVEEKKKP